MSMHNTDAARPPGQARPGGCACHVLVLVCMCCTTQLSAFAGAALLYILVRACHVMPCHAVVLQLVANATFNGAGGQSVTVYVSSSPGGLVYADTVVLSSPFNTMGLCYVSFRGASSTQGCVAQTAINAAAMGCASTAYTGGSQCTWVGSQCSYQGVTNNVVLDLTTCVYIASGATLTLTPVITDSGQVRPHAHMGHHGQQPCQDGACCAHAAMGQAYKG